MTEGQHRPPNVVLIMADQFKANASHLYGNAFTPHPLCVPARVSLWSGQYARTHGIEPDVPHLDSQTTHRSDHRDLLVLRVPPYYSVVHVSFVCIIPHSSPSGLAEDPPDSGGTLAGYVPLPVIGFTAVVA